MFRLWERVDLVGRLGWLEPRLAKMPYLFDSCLVAPNPQLQSSMKKLRWMQTWNKDSILEALSADGRNDDVLLWRKWCEKGWDGLKGGNVVFTDGSAESQRLNEENEQFRLSSLHREFGWLTINMNLLPRDLFEDMVKDSKNKP